MWRPEVNSRLAITRARAPLRLGFAGGGTDLSPYCDEFGGAVLNGTIDRYAYAFIQPRADGKVVFRSHDLGIEEVFDNPEGVSDSKLALHRGVYLRMLRDHAEEFRPSVTLTTTVDAPAYSGLGSSSALMVALVDAYCAYLDLPLGRYDVARLAFQIERIDLKLNGGKQDQYAAAFGGLNFIEFLPENRVIVNPLRMSDAVANELESSLVICFSGQSRQSAMIINEQVAGMTARSKRTLEALHRLKIDALDMKQALLGGDIMGMAEILDRSWESKKATASNISNPHIDSLYAAARSAGALGGKISGAGGGGFMMFICAPEDRWGLIETLNDADGRASAVKFTHQGSETWRVRGRE
jgi:D-glycero-alpha-D-manno-heptose-7-phosphate kinase